jgi:hypothetical protein
VHRAARAERQDLRQRRRRDGDVERLGLGGNDDGERLGLGGHDDGEQLGDRDDDGDLFEHDGDLFEHDDDLFEHDGERRRVRGRRDVLHAACRLHGARARGRHLHRDGDVPTGLDDQDDGPR